MTKLLTVFSAFVLLLGVASFTTVHAQSAQNGAGYQNSQPLDSNGTSTGTSNTGGGTTNTQDQNTGFNPWWLLPLLAIPLLFVFMRRDTTTTEDDGYQRHTGLAGTKGGQSRRELDEETTDEEV